MFLFPWVQMVVFSELAAYGPTPAKAEPLPGPAERKFQEMAAKHKIWLINGSVIGTAQRQAIQHAVGDRSDGQSDRSLSQDVSVFAVSK